MLHTPTVSVIYDKTKVLKFSLAPLQKLMSKGRLWRFKAKLNSIFGSEAAILLVLSIAAILVSLPCLKKLSFYERLQSTA